MNDLKEKLDKVRARMAAACDSSGRAPSQVQLLAVSKLQPAEKIRSLYAAGQADFGENYVQEALHKQQQLADLDIQWHFIGPLQSNKTREVAENFSWVQSVDREKLLRRLSAQRPKTLPPLNVCLQVNIDEEPQKAGAMAADVPGLARLANSLPGIRLRGLMAIPALLRDGHTDPGSLARVAKLYHALQAEGLPLDTLSMGMSADLEAAIQQGSTLVRIGTDLFGARPA
jgi:pyridoxal phosphate enzyme (YggS family)